jgi:hypothetical protein
LSQQLSPDLQAVIGFENQLVQYIASSQHNRQIVEKAQGILDDQAQKMAALVDQNRQVLLLLSAILKSHGGSIRFTTQHMVDCNLEDLTFSTDVNPELGVVIVSLQSNSGVPFKDFIKETMNPSPQS